MNSWGVSVSAKRLNQMPNLVKLRRAIRFIPSIIKDGVLDRKLAKFERKMKEI